MTEFTLWQKALLIYLLAVNFIAFLLMFADKNKAGKGKWRIPEKTLFISAAIGGSIGAIAGMYLFRHKTQHKSFTIGMPLILVLQIALVICLKIYVFK